ncbi:anti-sigma factor domain-containing protein [Calidifontibacillus oryziterrae]|uniref:anti-sigma factor domain-containing protein n=1 Tax=Calidifontibacillus oryziterrae TaxID=1191699 RepID=UPI0002D647AC|nr:anti-sigma factor domain-containing protein [Calidifontibacillus oryziterrae]
MKGVVLEIKNRNAIVLTKEGSFENVKLQNGQHVEVGAEIVMPTKTTRFKIGSKSLALAAAAAIIVIFLASQLLPFNLNNNMVIAAYVNLDINPSLEVGVDKHLHIVEVTPLNEDGQKIVDSYEGDITELTLTQFVNQTINIAKQQGYLNDKKDILLTATAIDKQTVETIETNIEAIKQEVSEQGIVVEELITDEKTREEAKNVGISPGKYEIYKQAVQTTTLTLEEAKDLSVSEIYEKLGPDKKESVLENSRKNAAINSANSKGNQPENNNSQKDSKINKEQNIKNNTLKRNNELKNGGKTNNNGSTKNIIGQDKKASNKENRNNNNSSPKTDSTPKSESNPNDNMKVDFEANPNSNGNSKENIKANSKANGNSKVDQKANPKANGNSKVDQKANPKANGNTKANTKANSKANGNSKVDQKANPKVNGNTKIDTKANPKANGNTKIDTKANPKANGNSKTDKKAN